MYPRIFFLASVVSLLALSVSPITVIALEDEMTGRKDTQSSIATEILSIEREVMHAIKTKDVDALRQFLAEDFMHRVPGQVDSDREAFLNGISSIPFEIVDVSGEDQKVSAYGEVAVLTGVQRATVIDDDGRSVISANAFTDVFELRENEWKMVLAFSIEINQQ